MAARIGSLYVDLTMNSAPFVAGMGQASSATSRAANTINRSLGLSQRTINTFSSAAGNRSFRPYAVIAASRAYETASDRANLLRGSLLAVTAVAGGFAAALGTNLISRYADTAINLNNALRTVTTSSSNLLAVQQELQDLSDRTRSSLQGTVTLYARTARASEKLGLSQDKLLRITETVQKAFSVGGATTEEAQGAAIQLSQAIASNRFSGDEFRSVAENAPVLLRGMAEAIGVNIGKLREMGKAGELNSDIVTKAILKASDRIDTEFAKTTTNIDRAITHVDNKMLEFVGNFDKSYGAVKLIAGAVTGFGDNLDKIIPPLAQVASLVGAVFLAKNRRALGSGVGGLLGAGLGFGVGGIQGAVLGGALGGFAGFAGTHQGAGFIGSIKADAAAARAEVLRLTQAEAELRKQTLTAGRQFYATKGQVVTSGVASFAPKSAQSDVAREALALQKLDAEIANGAQIAQQRAYQAQILARSVANAQVQGGAAAKQVLSEQAATYRTLQDELTGTSGRLALATKASGAFAVGMRAVGRAGLGLVNLFGGPWGIAIAGASLIFANFAEEVQRRAQSIANGKQLIDEVLGENPSQAPQAAAAGGVLATQIGKIQDQISQLKQTSIDAKKELALLFNADGLHTGPEQFVQAFKELSNIPIQGSIDKLKALTDQFVAGQIDVVTFTSKVDALKASTDNSSFDDLAGQVLGLANALAGAGPAADALRQKIVDLQAAAKDPVNLVISMSFDAIDKQDVNAPLTQALNNAAAGQAFTNDLDSELKTLRLVGDARKKAQYTDEEIKKAEKAGITITDAIRKRIEAYAKEKVALENRDAALKKSAKDDAYEKAIASLKEKTAAERLDVQLVGKSTFAVTQAKEAQDLLNAAREAGRKITPDLIKEINSEATAYAYAAEQARVLADNYGFYKDVFSNFFTDFKSNLLEGQSLWDAFANAGANALNKIADKALTLAANGIFDLIFNAFTGGGAFGTIGVGGIGIPSGGFIPGLTGPKLFAAGGFTGAGGRMQPAGVVHAGEYVMDARSTKRLGVGFLDGLRGYANGGYVTPASPSSMPNLLDAANSDAANDNIKIVFAPQISIHGNGVTRAEVDAALRASEKRVKKEVPQLVLDARRRGGV